MRTLFTIETADLRMTWSGPNPARPEADPLVVSWRSGNEPRVVITGGGAGVSLEEETTYLVLLQSLSGAPVALEHRDPVVVAGLVSADGGRVLHGRIRIGSRAGRIHFDVRHGSTVAAGLDFDVLPTKLSTAAVEAMRSEVEAAASGLSLAALRPTTSGYVLATGTPSVPVWLAALRQSVDALVAAVREVDRRPGLETTRPLVLQRSSQVRRPSAETRQALRRWGAAVPVLPARPARLTADTPAHRWLAARLREVDRQLATVLRAEARRRPTDRRRVVLRELDRLRRSVRDARSAAVFEPVGARPPVVPPLLLRRHPVYASAYDALRRLERGIALREGALDVATQDLAVLFETWAALAVVRGVAGALGVEPPARPFGVDAIGTDVRLRRGRAHGVRLAGRGVAVEIVNNPRFPAPPALLAQRPDLLLTIRRGDAVRRVVFDAKYRRDDSAAYRRRHGAAGPPEDALGTLHRYRDAIVEGPPVEVAAALFPDDSDDAFYRSRLWTSLGTLGVGAVPIQPGATDALARLLTDLLA